MQGIIKRYFKDKGYGFIAPDDGGKDIFFHHTQMAAGNDISQIKEGQKVSFDVVQGPKGQQANSISILAGE